MSYAAVPHHFLPHQPPTTTLYQSFKTFTNGNSTQAIVMFPDRWGSRRVKTSLAILLTLIWFYLFAATRDRAPSTFLPPDLQKPLNLSYLAQKINLSPQFIYAQRIIKTSHFVGARPDLTTVDEKLFPPLQTLTKADLQQVEYSALPPLTLKVPSSPEADTSIFAFGMATTVPRLNMSLRQLSHWLPHSQSPLYVLAPPNPERPIVEALATSLSMDISITPSEAPFPVAYFALIKLLYKARKPNTKWIVLMDDDTFIPSLPFLTHHLSIHYNCEEEVIVAALTDDSIQIDAWGLIPFGGGGIFISLPLAARLVSPEIWDRCEDGMGLSQGDGILSRCLNEYTSIRPTFDYGLNQMDIRAHPEGLFESGRRMLTVHHWRSWFDIDVARAGTVAKACGAECLWQRWVFPGENLVVSNGFSVVEYLDGVEGVDLGAVEQTWEGKRERFLFRVGPLREPVDKGRRVGYMLVDAEVVEGGVRQLYHRPWVDGEEGNGGLDRVLELFWVAN